MSTELIINASLPETRIVLMENGEIQELLIERASDKGIVGNIYKGRVTRVLPGMQAAFVDIGLEKAAFLYVDDVFVHPQIFDEEEGGGEAAIHPVTDEIQAGSAAPLAEGQSAELGPELGNEGSSSQESPRDPEAESGNEAMPSSASPSMPDDKELEQQLLDDQESDDSDDEDEDDSDELDDDEEDDSDEDEDDDDSDDEDEDEDDEPALMTTGGDGEDSGPPEGTMAPPPSDSGAAGSGAAGGGSGDDAGGPGASRRRHRRGRRGGRHRRRTPGERSAQGAQEGGQGGGEPGAGPDSPQDSGGADTGAYPENFYQQVADAGTVQSDRAEVSGDAGGQRTGAEGGPGPVQGKRAEFREPRNRDRRIRSRTSSRPPKPQANIQDLLQEGQEVLVQVAKDPIATKGARLTCHISLPGRHLVCMPTIDHVGVSRRIDRDDERRKLRELVEKNRPKNLGFIVRTASGRGQAERRVKQDIDYLTRLWDEIREKAASVTAPALVYEDLNSVLRAIRDWVTEDIDKIIVDSRYHYNEMQKFVSHFMPPLKQKVELYQGDIPIFDAYSISNEVSRSLERKVWLKSGGYIVVDQAEALVAIDVNTGRYVGKKNLEDTILKTNLEAVQEIAYQLRLRNCGGIIILDLIDMEKEENKQRVYRALEEALKKDRARPSILKISELGLVEMTRKRTRDTLVRAMCEPCVQCEGKGFIKSKQTVAYEVMRELEREGIERDVNKILVQAHADVIDILAIDERDTLDQLEKRYRKTIYLQAVQDFHLEQFEVIGEKRDRVAGSQGRDRQETRADQVGRGGGRDRNDRGRSGGRGGRDRGERGGRDRNDRSRGRNSGGGDRDRGPQQEGGPTGVVITGGTSGNEGAAIAPPAPTGTIIIAPRREPLPMPQAPMNGQAGQSTMSPAAGHSPTAAAPGKDDFFDEEDRLAFLRAQAAQDAALAQQQAGQNAAGIRPSSGQNRGGGGRGKWGSAGPSGGRGGQGAGAGGRSNNNNRRRRGRGSPSGGGGKFRGPSGPGMGDRGPSLAGSVPTNEGGGSSGGNGNGDGGNDGGGGSGGGDQSNPVT